MSVEVEKWIYVYKIQFLIIIEVLLSLFFKLLLFIYVSVPLYKHTHLEIDINAKSDRIEWGHARYQSVYRVDRAFELVVQWVTASGTIVADLVSMLLTLFHTC
jgi:cytochrome c oxidase assembly protein Cox11